MGYTAKEITKLYQEKELIDANEANDVFADFDVLNNKNGMKLCLYLSAHKIDLEKCWDIIFHIVYNNKGNLKPRYSELLGKLCLNLFIRSPESGASLSMESETGINRDAVADFVLKPIMEVAILSKEQSTAECFRQSPNAFIRLGACFVQQHVFPPVCDDKIEESGYMNRHIEAFKLALVDDSLPVRLQAIENVLSQFSFWFDDIPHMFRNELRQILDKLVMDQSVDTRAAVYKGFRFFGADVSARARLWAANTLKQYIPNGIDDTSEKVRLNVFRLLNVLFGMEEFVLSDYVPEPKLLKRLDFEENGLVEEQICKLLVKKYFECSSGIERLKRLMKLCDTNRNAAIDLHRVVIGSEILKPEWSLSHVCVITSFIPSLLRKYGGESEQTDDNLEEEDEDLETRINSLKGVLDCMIVSFTLIQPTVSQLGTPNSGVEVSMIIRSLRDSTALIFDLFEQNRGLVDSALTLATVSPRCVVCMPKFKLETERALRAGQLDEKRLQVFAMADMDKVVQILEDGLDQIRRASEGVLADHPSPPKKARRSSVFLNHIAVLDGLESLLAAPITNDYLMHSYDISVGKMIEDLSEIRENYLMVKPQKRGKLADPTLAVRCIDILTVVLILRHTEHSKVDRTNGKTKENQAGLSGRKSRKRHRKASVESVSSVSVVDPLSREVDFYKRHFKTMPDALVKVADVVGAFYRSIHLHARAYSHSKLVLDDAIELIEMVHNYQTARPRLPQTSVGFAEARSSLNHALGFVQESTTPVFSNQPSSSRTISLSPEL